MLTEAYVARPFNCDIHLARPGKDRCPHCNQWHLRPGYCQALDPMNAAKWPDSPVNKGQPVNTANTANTANQLANDESTTYRHRDPEVRRAYQRDYMRKRRSSSSGG